MPIGNPVTLTSNVASKTISVTATASQTLFNVTGGYRINELGVFKNGLRLQDGVDYTARDGLTVTLLSAASGGDKLQFVVFDTFRVAEAIRPNVDEQTIRGNLNVVGILSATSLGGLTNFNLTSGITTFNDVRVGGALTVAGTLTYEDVTNVDSIGIITARSYVSIADSIVHTGDIDTAIRFPAADTFTVETAGDERLRITSAGITTVVSGSFAIPAVPGANTNADMSVLFQTLAGTIDGGSGLSYNPAGDSLSVSGLIIGSHYIRTTGGTTLTLTTSSGNGLSDVRVQPATVQILGGGSEKLAVTVGGVNITGIATATQLYEGTTRVATSGKAIAMALIFG